MAWSSRDAEVGDEGFWGRPGRARLPISGSFLVDGLIGVVGFIVLFTIVGLVTLWPHGHLGRKGSLGPVRTLGAVAERVGNQANRQHDARLG